MFVASIAFLQGAERAPLIFKFSSAKTALFGVLLLLCYLKWLSIDAFVVLLSVVNFALACVLMRVVTAAAGFGGPDKSPLAPAAMLRYSVATLPHTVALWISVSSDRLMLGALVGKEAVGRYSLSYTVAQAVMVIISGVITALPPRIANDPDHWRIPGHVVGFLKKTALVCFAVLVMLLLFTSVNNHYLHIVPNTGPLSYYLIAIISAGFFFSNYYVLFASYLYLNRNTAALSTAGLLVGPVNLALFYGLIHFFGAAGAALGLVCSYANFGLAYGSAALKLEPSLRPAVRPIVLLSLAFLGAAVLLALLMGTLNA